MSRQSLRPCGRTSWVRQTAAAMHWIKQQGYGLVSSSGMQTWDLITALASLELIPMELSVAVIDVSDFASECERLAHEFALTPALVTCVPVTSLVARSDKRLLLSRRDRYVVQRADIVIPVCVRPDGNMAELVGLAEESGKRIVREFEIAPETTDDMLKYTLDGESINPALAQHADAYVIHWTRGVSRAWPGERLIDLYWDVIASSIWPRGAYTTLRRILDNGYLVASSRHMPGKAPCVCFSALPPAEVIPLMRWRARYGEMSFEPYGVGIRREIAEALGILPVYYYDSAETAPPGDVEPWRCQSIGQITDWREEKEYRCKGDFRFGEIPRDAVTLFCRTAGEAEELRAAFRYDVIPILA